MQENTTFDVTMGSFDEAEVCELVGLYILSYLAEKYGREFVGLYRDDRSHFTERNLEPSCNEAGKDGLHNIFESFQLKATLELHQQSVNFLDITLNLKDEKYQ